MDNEKECLFCVNSMSADNDDGEEFLVCFHYSECFGDAVRVDQRKAVCVNYKED